jgi:DNA modification methylase
MSASVSCELLQGDCLEVMRSIPAGTVHLVLTDPPFGCTNCHWDKCPDLAAWWAEVDRVTTVGSAVVVFSQQPFTTDLINSNRRAFRYELVWDKLAPVGFLNANRQPMRVHEHVLIFCRRPRQGVYNPQKFPGKPYTARATERKATPVYRKYRPVGRVNTGDRHPTSILRFAKPSGRDRRHPTQKPLGLMDFLVRSYSLPGQTVLDTFMGSGVTIEAAVAAGRHAIGIERDPAFYAATAAHLQARSLP